MSEQEGVELRLDALTQTTRFLAGAAPKAMTRLGLGVVLAVDDASHDPAAEILGAKVAEGAGAIGMSVQVAGQVVGAKASSAASSLKRAFREGADRAASTKASLGKVPAVKATGEFVGQAVGELRESWEAAGRIQVEVVAEESVPLVEEAASVEDVAGQEEVG